MIKVWVAVLLVVAFAAWQNPWVLAPIAVVGWVYFRYVRHWKFFSKSSE